MIRTICLVIEYDGSAYHGWQRQPNGLTIQEVMEQAVVAVTGERVPVIASGRTDAGVHALGQVASFRTHSPLPALNLRRALNGHLPPDIRVLDARDVAPEFHPQFKARGKTYLYVILNRHTPPAILLHRCWHIYGRLDRDGMRRGAELILGTHDFSCFQSSSCEARDPVRTLNRVELVEKGDLLELWVEGNGFLKNMVRTITGTLVEIGRGRMKAEAMSDILDARDRRRAGPCAPPRGLYLVSVKY